MSTNRLTYIDVIRDKHYMHTEGVLVPCGIWYPYNRDSICLGRKPIFGNCDSTYPHKLHMIHPLPLMASSSTPWSSLSSPTYTSSPSFFLSLCVLSFLSLFLLYCTHYHQPLFIAFNILHYWKRIEISSKVD